MIFLPVVERELRVTARRPATYFLRCLLALAVFGLWLVLMTVGQRRAPPVALSQTLFLALGILALAFCLFAGLIFAADCLSAEKRDGTLGLLFLTDLKGHDVVLGKLAATSLQAFYGLLGVLPVLALPLLMGGVTVGEFGRVVLVLVIVLFQSLSLSMFVSAISRETHRALMGAFLLILFLGGFLPMAWWIYQEFAKGGDWLLLASPVYTFQRAFDIYYRTTSGPVEFWRSLSIVFFLGLTAQVLACILLPRTWCRQWVPRQGLLWLRRWRQTRRGDSVWRSKLRRRELERNPYAWLSLQDRSYRSFTLLILGLIMPPWIFCLAGGVIMANLRPPPLLFIICLFSAYGLHQIFKLMVAVEATHQLSEDRHTGNLELVLTTPLPRLCIWSGIRRTLHEHLKAAFSMLSGVNGVLIGTVLLFGDELRIHGEEMRIFLEIFAGGLMMLFLDFWALSWVGPAAALQAKGHHQAILLTLGKVMGPSWLAIFLFVFIVLVGNIRQATFESLLVAWYVLGAVNDLIQGNRARQRIQAYFNRTLRN